MTNIDYKKMYEEVIFDKITIQKEFELYKTNIQKEFEQYKITQNEINDKLIKENEELKEHLKKYTAPKAYKKYYEKNKDNIVKKATDRLKKLADENPDKLKEYRRTAYLKQKEKIKSQTIK